MVPITTASDEHCKGFLINSSHLRGKDPGAVQDIAGIDEKLHELILVHILSQLLAMWILVCGLHPDWESCVMRGFSRGMRLVTNSL
jgi:hypothetical protein